MPSHRWVCLLIILLNVRSDFKVIAIQLKILQKELNKMQASTGFKPMTFTVLTSASALPLVAFAMSMTFIAQVVQLQ